MLLTSTPAVHADLWSRLEAFDLDGEASFSFSKRLARDNGWSVPFARRVVLEYKKFLFLAATCGHPVTPSDEVDQAWHLHLVYTRSYWDELCGQVLGFVMHHGPTKGGATEGHKFQDWYGQTLRAYHAAFGTAPPADIWPAAAIRFGEAPYFRRVNVRRYFLLRRPRWPVAISHRGWAALVAGLVLAGCTTRTPLNPFNWYGTEFLFLFWVLGLTLMPLSVWLAHRNRGPEDELPDVYSISTYELARLAGRGKLVAASALAALTHAGKVKLLSRQELQRTEAAPPTAAPSYEYALWELIAPAPERSKWAFIHRQALDPTLRPLRALDDTLEMKGLLLSGRERQRRRLYPLLTTLTLGLFGLIKVVVGLSRERPVEYLIVALGCLAFAGYYAYQHSPWTTGRGTRFLKEHSRLVRQERMTSALTPRLVALSVALFGAGELSAIGLGPIATYLVPPNSSSGGDGGGSGGDGGGSGCGGCGGCGGGD